jgi:hypothetical protein
MNAANRLGQLEQVHLLAHLGRQRVLERAGEALGDAVGELADAALLVALEARVDGDDAVEVHRRRLDVVGGLDLGVGDLPAIG